MRPSGRSPDALRPVTLELDVSKHAEGSCLIRMGDTQVLCTASVEDRVPHWLKGGGRGWVTAEYGMLPRATNTRTDREAVRGKQSGRTQEIQRLIGRALRAGVDLAAFGELVVKLDCDVLQADGGTRCASITGGYVALAQAVRRLERIGAVRGDAMRRQIAAVSCGLYRQTPVLDLDYDEDSAVDADANFVMTGDGALVEVQGTAEGAPFARDEFSALMDLAEKGVAELCAAQRSALRLSGTHS